MVLASGVVLLDAASTMYDSNWQSGFIVMVRQTAFATPVDSAMSSSFFRQYCSASCESIILLSASFYYMFCGK